MRQIGKYILKGIAMWFAFGFGGQLLEFVTNFIGLIYPFFRSILALESRSTSDYALALKYWIVFYAINLVPSAVAGWIPAYHLGKALFLVLCMVPRENNGASFFYNLLVLPVYKKLCDTIQYLNEQE